jgi:hypothetical protein
LLAANQVAGLRDRGLEESLNKHEHQNYDIVRA